MSLNSDVTDKEVDQLRKDISKKQESLRQKDLIVQDAVKRANDIEKKVCFVNFGFSLLSLTIKVL